MKIIMKIICYLLLILAGLTQQMYVIIPLALVLLSFISYLDISSIMDDTTIKPVKKRRKKALH